MHVFVSQVSLCSGCNVFHPYASYVIGIVGGMTYVAWSTLMLRVKVDDPLDAVAGKCHQNIQQLYSVSQPESSSKGSRPYRQIGIRL